MEIRPVSPGVSFPAAAEESAPTVLRDGQVVVGKVISTAGKTATVELAGRQIEVKTDVPLSPGDDLALKVAIGAGGQVRLKVMALQGSAVSLTSDAHLTELLERMGLPSDRAFLDAARLLLQEAGSVEPRWVREMVRWQSMQRSPAEREAAAFLLARGLIPTPEAIKLVVGRQREAESAGKRVGDRLDAVRRDDPDAAADGSALELPEDGDASDLAAALKRLIRTFTPPEARIWSALGQDGGAGGGLGGGTAEDALLDLRRQLLESSALVQSHQAGNGQAAASPAASELSRELRFQQLADATAPAPGNLAGPEVRVPLLFGRQRGELVVQRYAGTPRDPEGHSRLVVNLDLDNLGPIKVDLLYARGQVSGRILTADAATGEYLADRLDSLRAGITTVGVGVGHLDVSAAPGPEPPAPPRARFDLKL